MSSSTRQRSFVTLATLLEQGFAQPHYFPTGFATLDDTLAGRQRTGGKQGESSSQVGVAGSRGGLVVGSVTEFCGPPHCGKTTIALRAAAATLIDRLFLAVPLPGTPSPGSTSLTSSSSPRHASASQVPALGQCKVTLIAHSTHLKSLVKSLYQALYVVVSQLGEQEFSLFVQRIHSIATKDSTVSQQNPTQLHADHVEQLVESGVQSCLGAVDLVGVQSSGDLLVALSNVTSPVVAFEDEEAEWKQLQEAGEGGGEDDTPLATAVDRGGETTGHSSLTTTSSGKKVVKSTTSPHSSHLLVVDDVSSLLLLDDATSTGDDSLRWKTQNLLIEVRTLLKKFATGAGEEGDPIYASMPQDRAVLITSWAQYINRQPAPTQTQFGRTAFHASSSTTLEVPLGRYTVLKHFGTALAQTIADTVVVCHSMVPRGVKGGQIIGHGGVDPDEDDAPTTPNQHLQHQGAHDEGGGAVCYEMPFVLVKSPSAPRTTDSLVL